MKFSVWAPTAEQVDLVVGDARIAMGREPGGYFQVSFELPQNHGYRFSLDGGAPIPDPRTRWQPHGVHGESYPIELPTRQGEPFAARPLSEAIIYEMHVGTFTAEGTYRGAAAKLSHLHDLGITHVELMPLASFPGARGWGYDGVDLYAPLPAYGTPADLLAFVRACHAHGLAVLLDVVYNHLGPDGNYLGQFGPYFTDHYKTGWGAAINYDGPDSDQVRRFVIDNALMWLRDYEFDGLRLDAVHAIFSFEAVHVLEQLAAAVQQLAREQRRKLVLIAESDLNDPKLVRPVSRGGFGLDAHWEDDFHHALHAYFTGERAGYYADFGTLQQLAQALREGYVYQGQHSEFRRRSHGRPPSGIGADQIVVCSQNHDQIGNRAQGERLSMLLDMDKLKAIAALTLLSPFVPMLFQGEEWGASTPFLYFTDHTDRELGRAVTEGRAREFASFNWSGEVPDPQETATFNRSKLNWLEVPETAHSELLQWYRSLIGLRRANLQATASRKRPHVKIDPRKQTLVYRHGGLAALLNLSAREQRLDPPAGAWQRVLASHSAAGAEALPAGATVIYQAHTT